MANGVVRSPRLQWTLVVDRDLYGQIQAYHQTSGIEGSFQETLRELLRMGIASDPEPVVSSNARKRVTKQVQRYVLHRVSSFLHDLASEIEAAASMDPSHNFPVGEEASE